MAEPVGNSPRGAIPSNSFRDREGAKAPNEPREKVQKVVEGKVVFTKKPWYKRAAREMVADDVTNIGEYLLIGVAIPAFKNLLFDIITQAVGRTLYEGGRAVTRGGFGQTQQQSMGVREKYSQYSGGTTRREISATARSRHEFDDVTLDDRDEAIKVVSDLVEMAEKYGQATVYELFELLGSTGSHADQNWGWTDLREASVVQNRGGWRLALPPPIELKR